MKIQSKIAALLMVPAFALHSHAQGTPPTPIYQFRLDSLELANTGSIGGHAKILSPSAKAPSVTNDAERKTNVLVFPASETKLGSWMEFPESNNKLRLNEVGQEMTLSAWIRWNGPLPDVNRQCIATTMGPAQKQGWSLTIGKGGELIFNWQLPNGSGGARITREKLKIGQWTHIALLCRSLSKQEFAFYINGESAPSEGGPGSGPLLSGNDPIRFGAFGSSKQGYAPLNAAIADIVFYDTALEGSQLSALATRP